MGLNEAGGNVETRKPPQIGAALEALSTTLDQLGLVTVDLEEHLKVAMVPRPQYMEGTKLAEPAGGPAMSDLAAAIYLARDKAESILRETIEIINRLELPQRGEANG